MRKPIIIKVFKYTEYNRLLLTCFSFTGDELLLLYIFTHLHFYPSIGNIIKKEVGF